MNKDDKLAIVLAALIFFMMVVIFTEKGTHNRMKRQAVEGYVATPTYQTNEAKEVTIKSISWEKKK